MTDTGPVLTNFSEGSTAYWAFYHHGTPYKNPYPTGTEQHDEWELGFEDARTENYT